MTPVLLPCWGLALCLWWLPSARATPLGRLAGSDDIVLRANDSLPLTPGDLPSEPEVQVLGQQQVSGHSPRVIILTPLRDTAAAHHMVTPWAAPTTVPSLTSEGGGTSSARLKHATLVTANTNTAVTSSTTVPSTVTLATTVSTTFTSVFDVSTTPAALDQDPAVALGVHPPPLELDYLENLNNTQYSVVYVPFRDCPNECEVRIYDDGECVLDFSCISP